MLPGIKPLKLPPSVLLPAHAFRANDNLKIKFIEPDSEMEIRLESIKEHTGSFTQFQYISKDLMKKIEKEEKIKSSAKNKDNFDEIWSSL
jgi:hypothetical protein